MSGALARRLLPARLTALKTPPGSALGPPGLRLSPDFPALSAIWSAGHPRQRRPLPTAPRLL